MVGQFVPKCAADGSYAPVQCYGSIGFCWCVDRDGKELPNTRVRGQPKCTFLKSLASRNKFVIDAYLNLRSDAAVCFSKLRGRKSKQKALLYDQNALLSSAPHPTAPDSPPPRNIEVTLSQAAYRKGEGKLVGAFKGRVESINCWDLKFEIIEISRFLMG